MFRWEHSREHNLVGRGGTRVGNPIVVMLAATCALMALATPRVSTPKMDAAAAPEMPYRLLGNTGLAVSVLSYGTWVTYGAKEDLMGKSGVEMAKDCFRVARKAGVNLFDNAETYGVPVGAAEQIMGEAIKELQAEDAELWRRSDLVLTTKIFWGGKGVNERGLSRKHLTEGLTASLERLQLDYVDLVFCHRPDPYTPTETVVRGMTDLVRSGKATAWGTSEWSAAQIVEAVWIARTYGLEPPQFEQPQYNMMHRQRFETEYFPIFAPPYNFGTTIWSPLASGLLTGKYAGGEIPAGSRASAKGYEFIGGMVAKWQDDGSLDKVAKLTEFARDELGCSMAQLAIAWCLKNPKVSTCLLGATKPEQLEETIGALDVVGKLTEEHLASIDDILDNKPEGYAGYGAPFWARTVDTLD